MRYYKYRSDSSYRPSMGGFSLMPPVIKFLLIANGAIFLVQMLFGSVLISGAPLNDWITLWGYLWPRDSIGFHSWQLITYMFLHAGFMHILFNMFALWMFGVEIENVMGSQRFAVYYLICGLGAAFAQLYIAPLFSTPAPTLGASGAIFGVLIAFGIMFPDRLIYLYFFLPVKAKYAIIGFIVLEIWAAGGTSNVAHLAHLGGAAVGFLYLFIEDKIPIEAVFERFGSFFKRGPNLRFQQGGNVGMFSSPHATDSRFKDAKYKDVSSPGEEVTQEVIDSILDKISKGGYKNLSEDEKRILFEASKKIH